MMKTDLIELKKKFKTLKMKDTHYFVGKKLTKDKNSVEN